MRLIMMSTVAAMMLVSAGAAEAGCVTGAVVGGVAGHLVGHGAVGAAAGCAVGHHNAKKKQQQTQH